MVGSVHSEVFQEMQGFRAAAVQMRSGLDLAANVSEAERLVRQAAYKGLDLGKDPRRVVRERPSPKATA